MQYVPYWQSFFPVMERQETFFKLSSKEYDGIKSIYIHGKFKIISAFNMLE